MKYSTSKLAPSKVPAVTWAAFFSASKFTQPAGHSRALRKSLDPLKSARFRRPGYTHVLHRSNPEQTKSTGPCVSSSTSVSTVITFPTLKVDDRSSLHSPRPSAASPAFRAEIASLPAMELRRRYPAEARSHDNMKLRVAKRGDVVAPEFQNWKSFLAILGPMPAPGMTVDKIDPKDPVYGRGRVRWATKRQQTGNRTNTVRVEHPLIPGGMDVAEIARRFELKLDTVRHRLHRGWNYLDFVAGRKGRFDPATFMTASDKIASNCNKISMFEARKAYEALHAFTSAARQHHPNAPVETIEGRHIGKTKRLLTKPYYEFTLAPALEHAAEHWPDFTDRAENWAFAKKGASPAGPCMDFALLYAHVAVDLMHKHRADQKRLETAQVASTSQTKMTAAQQENEYEAWLDQQNEATLGAHLAFG